MGVATDPVDVFLVEPATRGDPQHLRSFDPCRKHRPEWRAPSRANFRSMCRDPKFDRRPDSAAPGWAVRPFERDFSFSKHSAGLAPRGARPVTPAPCTETAPEVAASDPAGGSPGTAGATDWAAPRSPTSPMRPIRLGALSPRATVAAAVRRNRGTTVGPVTILWGPPSLSRFPESR